MRLKAKKKSRNPEECCVRGKKCRWPSQPSQIILSEYSFYHLKNVRSSEKSWKNVKDYLAEIPDLSISILGEENGKK